MLSIVFYFLLENRKLIFDVSVDPFGLLDILQDMKCISYLCPIPAHSPAPDQTIYRAAPKELTLQTLHCNNVK